MADKLTPKQERYVQGLFAGLSQREAYKQAFNCVKMADKTIDVKACELAKQNNITVRLTELQNELKERNMITVEYVLSTIHETVERCRQNYPVLDRKGKQVYVETPSGDMLPAYEFDAKDVLKGCELLGKHLGMFVDRKEISGPDGAPIEIESPEQRQKRIEALLKKRDG